MIWFFALHRCANFAVLLYRMVAMERSDWTEGDEPLDQGKLLLTGIPFCLAGVAYMVRDNIDRALLMFLLGAGLTRPLCGCLNRVGCTPDSFEIFQPYYFCPLRCLAARRSASRHSKAFSHDVPY